MLRPRIVVCLDVKDGRVVKGTRFRDLRDVGDPVELARRYEAEGADEIVYLDVSASDEGRGTLLEAVRRTAEVLFIPLTVGGGVRSVEDMDALLRAGADKVAVNTAAVASPGLLAECAERFGAQCVVVSVDAAEAREGWEVRTHGGKRPTGLDAVEWAARCARSGAGEVLLTSIDRDGTRSGYDLDLTAAIARRVTVPVVASGGAGEASHLRDALREGGADAVLVAGILHDGETTVPALKEALARAGIPVRAAAADAVSPEDAPALPPNAAAPAPGAAASAPGTAASSPTDRRIRSEDDLEGLDFERSGGLVPVVAQDADSGRVLMVAWADREAFERTLQTGEVHFHSRTRDALWRKGETSGNVFRLRSLHADCDGDTVLALVEPAGPACHTGDESCFGWRAAPSPPGGEPSGRPTGGPDAAEGSDAAGDPPESILSRLQAVLEDRARERPEGSWTVRLLDDPNLRIKKLGEETAELVAALAANDERAIPEEAADLLYHLMVALLGAGVPLPEVLEVLGRRKMGGR